MIRTEGFAIHSPGASFLPFAFFRRALRPHDLLIKVHFCGLCHTDVHQAFNDWGGSIYPLVPGHEIVGEVVDLGHSVVNFAIGDIVGVGGIADSCRSCVSCNTGLEQYCSEDFTGIQNCIERDGFTVAYGGLCSFVVVDFRYVIFIPKNVSPSTAAPLLCAGISVYSIIKHLRMPSSARIAVFGLGGLGHLAVKFLHSLGFSVTVITRTAKKKLDAFAFGANEVVVSSDAEDLSHLSGRFDYVFSTLPHLSLTDSYLDVLGVNGVFVLLAIPGSDHHVGKFSLIKNRRSIIGSSIGGIAETAEMFSYVSKTGIEPTCEFVLPSDLNNSFQRLKNGEVRYRLVVDFREDRP